MPWHRENKAEQGLDGPCHNQTQFFPILGKGWGGGGGEGTTTQQTCPDTASSYGSSFHTQSLRTFFHQHLNILQSPQRSITHFLWVLVLIPSNIIYMCRACHNAPHHFSAGTAIQFPIIKRLVFPLELQQMLFFNPSTHRCKILCFLAAASD